MLPQIPTPFTMIGPVNIRSFTFLLALAIVLTLAAALFSQRHQWAPAAIFEAGIIALLLGIAGARLGHVLLHWDYFVEHQSEILQLRQGGLNWHGALLGGWLGLKGCRMVARWREINGPWLTGALSFAIPIFTLAAWRACISAFCAYGREIETLYGHPAWLADWAADIFTRIAPRYNTASLGTLLALRHVRCRRLSILAKGIRAAPSVHPTGYTGGRHVVHRRIAGRHRNNFRRSARRPVVGPDHIACRYHRLPTRSSVVSTVIPTFPKSRGPLMANYDLILRNGNIYDGSGAAPIVGDLGIHSDRIVYVGPALHDDARQEVDVSGLAVAPGFINMLSWAVESLIHDGRSQSDIRQGVTLEVMGEGFSFGPLSDAMKAEKTRGMLSNEDLHHEIEWTTLGEYLEFLERRGVSCNIASFVGTATLRIHQVGYGDRPPTAAELAGMQALVREAMEEGAIGLSSALIYPPAAYAKTDELIALASVAAEYDGLYICHLRSEGALLL